MRKIKMANIMKRLETERLVLRTIEESDAADFYEYSKSPIVGPDAGWKPHESIEESKKVIQMFRNEMEVWAIELKETGKIIGSVGIHKSSKGDLKYDRELGYALSDKYWGRGIMTEAAKKVIEYAFCEATGINTICVSHFTFNHRSERVIDKCGFKYIKTIKECWKRFDGKCLDEDCYLLTKEMYLAEKNK